MMESRPGDGPRRLSVRAAFLPLGPGKQRPLHVLNHPPEDGDPHATPWTSIAVRGDGYQGAP